MKLLVICQYYYPEPFKITELCKELTRVGYSVTVLTGIPNYPEGKPYKGYGWFRKRKEYIDNIEIIRVPIIYRGKSKIQLFLNYISFLLSGSIYALNQKFHFDEVLVYQLSPIFMAIPGIFYAKIHKKPLVLYTLDLWPESFIETEKLKNTISTKIVYLISRFIYLNSDMIGVSSKGFIDPISKMGIPPKKIVFIPQYSVDPYPEMLVSEIRGNLNRVKRNVNIIFTGNIGVAQNLEIILDAANVTKVNNAKIKWIVVGDGRAKAELVSECSRRRLDDVVEFIPRVLESEVFKLLRTSDIALLTLGKSKLFEHTVPAKLQTYMACGIPILASVDGETANIIKDSKCGVVAPAEDGDALGIQALKFAKMSSEELLLYSNNARKYFLKNFIKDTHIIKINELLKHAFGKEE